MAKRVAAASLANRRHCTSLAAVSTVAMGLLAFQTFSILDEYAQPTPSLDAGPVHVPTIFLDTSNSCNSSHDTTRVLPDELLISAHCPPLPRAPDAALDADGYDEAELDALRPIATAASLRSGYRYEFVRRHEAAAPASRLVLEDRLMCMDRGGDWAVFVTGDGFSLPRDVDAAATAKLGYPLVGAARLHAALAGGAVRLNNTWSTVQRAAELLRGQLAHAPQAADNAKQWAPARASNAHWRDVLGMDDVLPCTDKPSQQPRCLRRYIKLAAARQHSARAGGDAQREMLRLRGMASQPARGSTLFGRDDGGNAFVWHASCTACLWSGVVDGLFLMWQPRWLLSSPLTVDARGQTVRSAHGRPIGLISHWNCSVVTSTGWRAQCALPVRGYPPETRSASAATAGGSLRGDVVLPAGGVSVEVLNRTAFVSAPLWPSHYTHRWFNYLLPTGAIMHDLPADASRDVLATHEFKYTVPDMHALVDTPQLRRAGLLSQARVGASAVRRTCFARSVLGSAYACPSFMCGHPMGRGVLDAEARCVRTRLGMPQPPAKVAPPHTVYVLQREAGTRSLVNAAQLLDILRAFHGLVVHELTLEDATLADQVRIFSNASLVVASHGNALGNLMWMPRGSAVMEYLGEGFETAFFSWPGRQRGITWHQGRCRTSSLGKALDAGFVRGQLSQLKARPKLAWLVGEHTEAALLRVQEHIEGDKYEIPAGVALASVSHDATINAHTGGAGRATCVFESARRDDSKRDKADAEDPKHRHVYVPAHQFLEDFVKLALEWEGHL